MGPRVVECDVKLRWAVVDVIPLNLDMTGLLCSYHTRAAVCIRVGVMGAEDGQYMLVLTVSVVCGENVQVGEHSIRAPKIGVGSSYGWDREPRHQRCRRIDS